MKKSKTFARKIVAIVLAVLMAMSTFTGVLTVYAKSTDDGHDSNLAANFMTWAETTDNQTCEALLDWVDDTLNKAGIAPIKVNLNYVVVNININGYLDSVDGALDLVKQASDYLNQYKSVVGGDVSNIYLNPIADLECSKDTSLVTSKCQKSYRAVNDAKDIVMALAETIYWNSNDDTSTKRTNKNVIGQFIKGKLNLGVVNSAVDVYGLIGNLLNMWDGYESNLVYNMLAQTILTKTNWFSESEVESFQAYLKDNTKGTKWNFDEQLLSKLSSQLLSKISVEMTYALERNEKEDGTVTYEPTDSSKTRYSKIKAYLAEEGLSVNDKNISTASEALGYDPNLRYDSNGDGMIYLFRYGNSSGGEDTLTLNPTDKFYDIVNKALKLVWKTTLKPTLRTMRVNNSMDWYEGHGGNFDNTYYYWLASQGMIDQSNWENNYTEEKFNKYLEANYSKYDCANAEEFRDYIQATFEYDRSEVEDPQYNWRDVSKSNDYVTDTGSRESILFGKLRYSPLADKVYNMQTGPINLYFMQTGFSNLETFIDNYVDGKTAYPNIVAALNNGLVAAVKDLFPDSSNIGIGKDNKVTTNIARPALTETGTSPSISEIASTLVSNTMKMFEYAANVTDENILGAFYHNNNITDKTSCTHLTEENFEEAMMPLLIGCIRIVKTTRSIHDTDFDYAKDAEGVAYVVLREHLSYSQPNKDYDQLVKTTSGSYEAAIDVNGDGSKTMFEDAILPMCRDAVGYLLSSIVPCRKANGDVWDFEKSDPVTDKTTLFEILNSVVCYYASTEEFNEPTYNTITSKTYGKGVAALLGVVDESGSCLVKMSNSLWDNLSIIANKIWPTIGTLQYGTSSKAGQANAEELIYNTVIKSLLDISDTHSDGSRGITTIVKQLLTIFTAEPIMSKGVDVLIYDEVVASLVNGIFGAKISGQAYAKVIPTASEMNTTTPFDSLVDQAVFAKYKGDGSKENGVLGILISNIYCAFGGYTAVQNSTRGSGCWQGAMFAVKAVSYFVDGFLPQLKDHEFGAASISINDPSRSDFSFDSEIENTYVTIKNESVGLNRFYKDSDGNVCRDDRYFVDVKSVESSSSSLTVEPYSGVLAPEKSVQLAVKGNYPSAAETITFTLTYDIYKGTTTNPKTKLKYSDQTAVCYLNLSADKGWFGELKDTDSEAHTSFSEDLGEDAGGYGNKLNKLVLSSSNPTQAESIGIDLKSQIYGVYAADESGNAYTTYATETIDGTEYIEATNVDMYDYRIDTLDSDGNVTDRGEWQCGDSVTVNGIKVYKGYTYDEVKAVTRSDNQAVVQRTHVATSVKKGSTNAALNVVYNATGEVESVSIAPEAVANACATAASPVKGLDFVSIEGSDATYKKWLKVEESVSSLPVGEYTMTLKGYNDTDTDLDLGDDVSITVADTSGAATLQKAYQTAANQINPYQISDYKDKDNGTSETYNEMQKVFKEVLEVIATAATEDNVKSLSGTKEVAAVTTTVTSETGDKAYKPATSVTGDMANIVHKKGNYYYIDEACTIPVCTNELITSSDVTDGKDALGRQVELQGDIYYLVNDYVYEKEWDTKTYEYPYYGTTSTVSQYEAGTDKDGSPIMKNYYAKETHSYYTEDGMKVNSSDDWAYTYANIQTITKPNDGENDYRSVYAMAQDKMSYYVQKTLKEGIDTSAMEGITGETGLMKERSGKESINYDVESYEKMVQIAKEAEALVTNTGEKDSDGNYIYTTTATSAQLKEAVDNYTAYNARVKGRGYEGAKLEAELSHLTGTTKANITATFDEDSEKVVSNGVVKMTAGTPKYGKIVDGQLVNQGDTVYSDATWTNYVNALAKAVSVAKEEKEENISGTYEAKKNLVIAENALAEPEEVTSLVVSGTVTEAVDGTGTAGTYALQGVKFYNGSTLLGKSKADGSFSIELPLGETTTVTIKANNGITRTVTFSEAKENVQIGIVELDYNGDGKVNSTDVALASKTTDIGTKITADQFKAILKSGVNYAALS